MDAKKSEKNRGKNAVKKAKQLKAKKAKAEKVAEAENRRLRLKSEKNIEEKRKRFCFRHALKTRYRLK